MEDTKADLRYASDEERRYALACLRWLSGRSGQARQPHRPPRASHRAYGLTRERGEQILAEVRGMARDAALVDQNSSV